MITEDLHLPVEISTIAFEILERCNLFCDFCIRNATKQHGDNVSVDLFKKRLDAVLKNFPHIKLVALTGGEPFLHKDIINFVDICFSQDKSACITTNATVLNKATLEALSKYKNCHLIVSIDGPENIHDKVRGKEGAFNKLQEFMLFCRELDITTLVNITVNENNANYVEETIFIAYDFGARDISVALVKPEGRGDIIHNGMKVFTNVSRQIASARRKLYHTDVKIFFTEPLAHITEVYRETSRNIYRCGAVSGSLHIQANGNVLLCTSCKQSLGNIDEIGEILRERYLDDYRSTSISNREKLGGECGACFVGDACSGCRCRAEKGDKGFLGGDPLCPKNTPQGEKDRAKKAIEKAEESLFLKNSKDPIALKKWLEGWTNQEHFTRDNKNFTGQKRWGHSWDLGDGWSIQGEMANRHKNILYNWIKSGSLPSSLKGMKILDIGPWTGGETFFLSALGAQVDVVEESDIYKDAITYVANQFSLNIRNIGSSLYDLTLEGNDSQYDAVYMSGIVSHLSDPIVGLRTVFNQLKNGGVCLLETQTSYAYDGRDEYWGVDRPGWIWFNLSRDTLLQMLYDVGFRDLEIVDFSENRRIQIVARRNEWFPLGMRMGLSYSSIK